jgi:hypothetical protein
MQIIQSEILINAPKELVWQILMDRDNYNLWNPFTPKIETNFEIGTDIILHVNMNPGKKLLLQKEQILWVKDNESVAWGIPGPLPVKTERAQNIIAISPEQTQYITYDKFWGPLVPLVIWLYGKKIQAGFDSVAAGLKTYAEAQYKLG